MQKTFYILYSEICLIQVQNFLNTESINQSIINDKMIVTRNDSNEVLG